MENYFEVSEPVMPVSGSNYKLFAKRRYAFVHKEYTTTSHPISLFGYFRCKHIKKPIICDYQIGNHSSLSKTEALFRYRVSYSLPANYISTIAQDTSTALFKKSYLSSFHKYVITSGQSIFQLDLSLLQSRYGDKFFYENTLTDDLDDNGVLNKDGTVMKIIIQTNKAFISSLSSCRVLSGL